MDRRVRLSAYAPILLWVVVIFFLSSDTGSAAQTSRFVRPLLHFLFPAAAESTIDSYHFYIRKAAHFTEYAVLALLIARTFLVLGRVPRYWPLAVTGLAAVIACLDELNQSFLASRTASPYDSLLDICGAVSAVLILWLILRRRPATATPPPAAEAPV